MRQYFGRKNICLKDLINTTPDMYFFTLDRIQSRVVSGDAVNSNMVLLRGV